MKDTGLCLLTAYLGKEPPKLLRIGLTVVDALFGIVAILASGVSLGFQIDDFVNGRPKYNTNEQKIAYSAEIGLKFLQNEITGVYYLISPLKYVEAYKIDIITKGIMGGMLVVRAGVGYSRAILQSNFHLVNFE